MRRALALTALLPSLLAGCGGSGDGEAATSAPPPDTPKLTLTSPAFGPGATIPKKYTCSGPNISPPLAWSKPPSGTKALVLTLIDPDAPSGGFGHWAVVLPAGTRGLEAGERLGRAVVNDGGKPGYTGPCPPPGDHPHHYVFTLYAVRKAPTENDVFAVNADALRSPLASGRLTGRFGR